MKNNFSQGLKVVLLALFIAIGTGYLSAWVGPPAGIPPACSDLTKPGCNPPINTGASQQSKSGYLVVGGFRSTGPAMIDELLTLGNDDISGSKEWNIYSTNDPGGYDQGSGKLLIHRSTDGTEATISADYSTGYVGVGTASPSSKLEVAGKIQATGGDVCTDQGGGICLSTVGGGGGGSGIGCNTTNMILDASLYSGYFHTYGKSWGGGGGRICCRDKKVISIAYDGGPSNQYCDESAVFNANPFRIAPKGGYDSRITTTRCLVNGNANNISLANPGLYFVSVAWSVAEVISGDNNYTYVWSGTDIPVGTSGSAGTFNGRSLQHSYNTLGVKDVSLTITSPSGGDITLDCPSITFTM